LIEENDEQPVDDLPGSEEQILWFPIPPGIEPEQWP